MGSSTTPPSRGAKLPRPHVGHILHRSGERASDDPDGFAGYSGRRPQGSGIDPVVDRTSGGIDPRDWGLLVRAYIRGGEFQCTILVGGCMCGMAWA